MTMHQDDIRARFLNDRVMTATPAQRIVMLYDRMLLDLRRAAAATDAGERAEAGSHLGHAIQIVVELQTSLDRAVGGAAENLAALYAYVTGRLIAIRGGNAEPLPEVTAIVTRLRDAWAQVAEGSAANAATSTTTGTTAGSSPADGPLTAAGVGGAWVS